MQTITQGAQGLGVLFEINNDRLFSALIIATALAAVGYFGAEYAQSFFVQADSVPSPIIL